MRGWSPCRFFADRGCCVVPAHAGLVPSPTGEPWARAGGPRACGVGPSAWWPTARTEVWSPRMRGWSPRYGALGLRSQVVPAHAGLVPRPGTPPCRPGGGPRACGVGPQPALLDLSVLEWSPRMRGWSPPPRTVSTRQHVVPAHAGLVPPRRDLRIPAPCGPRACGVGPVAGGRWAAELVWSPRMRGWSQHSPGFRSGGVVVPAHAGLVPFPIADWSAWPCGPRACGVGPGQTWPTDIRFVWSPRMRGWSLAVPASRQRAAVVPAHAGLVPRAESGRSRFRRGPRACGVGPLGQMAKESLDQWSPRMRGWSHRRPVVECRGWVVPAHAGLVPLCCPAHRGSPGGPRACGVGPSYTRLHVSCGVWSPRMRGWSRQVCVHRCRDGVVPAHAGLVPSNSSSSRSPCSGPRACGVGPSRGIIRANSDAWSPRMRGWSLLQRARHFRKSVVPAHAGLVPEGARGLISRKGGPRACGVGPRLTEAGFLCEEWSPRMRGWSRSCHRIRPRPGVVPAHAGLVPDRQLCAV